MRLWAGIASGGACGGGLAARSAVPLASRTVLRLVSGLALLVGGVACKKESTVAAPIDVRLSWGETGIQPGQMNYPRAIDADEDAVWVIDKAAQAQRFDAATGRRTGGWRLKDFQFGKPTGVTCWRLGDRDLLLVPETHYHRVTIFEIPKNYTDGEPPILTRFGSFGRGDGEFTFPTDVAVLPGEGSKGITRLYVSEYGGNDRISVFDAADPMDPAKGYRFAFAFGTFGDSATKDTVQFSRPQSMEIDQARRELVVTDACNHRVGRFTLDGKLIAWIGSPETAGEAPGSFLYPYGLKLLGDGTALISEFQGSRVQHLDLLTGRSLGVFGTRGRGAGQVTNPWGITVHDSMAYVLDSGNDRVIGFARPRAVGQRRDDVALGVQTPTGSPATKNAGGAS